MSRPPIADRRERFTREALAVAALNHPHIVTIHSVEDAGTTVFLTMELVEGRSLAEALPSGRAAARTRADDRDRGRGRRCRPRTRKGSRTATSSPRNIMLGEGEHAGRIKVLDFGLAKVVEAQLGAAGASMLPTEAPAHTAPITAEGRILGTVAYMSPEQAEGRAIDGRSDLFSLGVVLYEMATGQRPFTGDTNLSILSSILKDTPRSVTDINPALPRDLGRIIRRALAKDPERRYQSAKDLRNDLEDLKASLDSGELTRGSRPPSQGRRIGRIVHPSHCGLAGSVVRRASRGGARHDAIPARLAVAAVVLLVGVAAALYVMLRRDAQPASTTSQQSSLADLQITQLTTSGNAERPAISPDGRYVAYVQRDGDDDSLWIRQTTTTSNVRIVAPERGVALFGATFTPDGTSVDFVRQASWSGAGRSGACRFWAARPDCSSPTWRAPSRGRQTASASRSCALESRPALSSQLIVADADGGQERELASAGDVASSWISLVAPWRPNIPPAWSPDGRLIAVAAASRPDGRTDRLRGQRDRVDAGGHGSRRGDGRTQLARCPVARAQLASPARRPEPVVSAAVSRRLRVAAHQRSERLRRGSV